MKVAGFLNIWKLFGKKETSPKDKKKIEVGFLDAVSEIQIRELAFNMMTNRIASAIAKCEIRTYEKNKRKKSDEWYKWNIQPNPNQNATDFWMKFVHSLYHDNEALIIKMNGDYYVADSFYCDDSKAFIEHTFKSVTINNLTLDKVFKMSEVFYFKQSNERIKALTDSISFLYGKLISTAYSSYKAANGNKGILKISQMAELKDDFENVMNEILNEDFKAFFESSNAVLPLYDGIDYEPVKKTSGPNDTRDIRNLLNDVIEITAMAFGMSKQLATGDVADTSKAVEDFLTFVIDPLTELISDEINRKNYTRTQIISGDYIKFDTSKIKHIDLFDAYGAIEKLVSSGCFTINDIREHLGQEKVNEEWADQFFMTKNYAPIEELLREMKGGNGDG